MSILEVKDLSMHFPVREGLLQRVTKEVKAVRKVSFNLEAGDSYGVVGESGSGKTTLARSVLRLLTPTSGEVLFQGENLAGLQGEELRQMRRHMQMVFQDPHSSLNPRKTILKNVGEPLVIFDGMKGKALAERVQELLELVGLGREHMYRFPHELSGGQKQRVGIARALALRPKLLMLDEPTSALDVSVQALTLNLLEELQKKLSLTYLFISHNLAVIRYVCDRVAVMYLGQIVEEGPVDSLFDSPAHPYTRFLLSAVPSPEPQTESEEQILEGDIPSPLNLPSGCSFHTRCPVKIGRICETTEPVTTLVGEGHTAACHLCRGDQ
jgi:oligopeptide/dipeptide ABC transporter ATP-binding protein